MRGKGGKAKISQRLMKGKEKTGREKRDRVDIAEQFVVYCKDLDDSLEDVHINPLPTPAFVHFEASNTETPKFRFTPALDPRLHRKTHSDYVR